MLDDEFGRVMLFTNGFLAMEANMRTSGFSDFFAPEGHAEGINSQFKLVVNRTKMACRWLNSQTDHLDEKLACEFVKQGLEECIAGMNVGQRKNSFGQLVDVKSSIKIVAVTCYPAAAGSVSGAVNDRTKEVATRRFLVHYNGF